MGTKDRPLNVHPQFPCMSSSPNLQHIAQTRFTQIQMLLRMQIKKSAFWKCWRNDRGNIRTAMPL